MQVLSTIDIGHDSRLDRMTNQSIIDFERSTIHYGYSGVIIFLLLGSVSLLSLLSL